ncbi:MAG: hypothetical protein HY909_16050 [Deltaproteobacteria bacterium]|nr:hypothetical protein [Deltaproteobacteria bacterium]
MHRLAHFALVTLFPLAVGCGSGTTVSPDAGTTGDAPVGDSPGTDAPIPDAGPGGCPSAAPTAGASCTPQGLACQHGDDPRPRCRPLYTCTAGRWMSPQLGDCPTPPPAMCPATRDLASGQACSTEGAYCTYQGIPCECTNCIRYPVERCEGARTWRCEAPSMTVGCPSAQPNVGSACGREGLECRYGCEGPRQVTCRSGRWSNEGAFDQCPISRRSAKRDIHYLTEREVEALARELQRLPLATWEYRDPALQGRRRLGFLLDDAPGSFASDLEHGQVDLYGYTSLLAAAVQSQGRELSALRRELAALRAQGHGHRRDHAPTR